MFTIMLFISSDQREVLYNLKEHLNRFTGVMKSEFYLHKTFPLSKLKIYIHACIHTQTTIITPIKHSWAMCHTRDWTWNKWWEIALLNCCEIWRWVISVTYGGHSRIWTKAITVEFRQFIALVCSVSIDITIENINI